MGVLPLSTYLEIYQSLRDVYVKKVVENINLIYIFIYLYLSTPKREKGKVEDWLWAWKHQEQDGYPSLTLRRVLRGEPWMMVAGLLREQVAV